MKKTLVAAVILLFSSYLSAKTVEEILPIEPAMDKCDEYLDKADKIIQRLGSPNYDIDYENRDANKALVYMKRYEICQK